MWYVYAINGCRFERRRRVVPERVEREILIDAPVFVERNVGAYVSTEQPDQATVNTGNKGFMERQTVPEVRLMFQLAF